jgi:hypothetical protein
VAERDSNDNSGMPEPEGSDQKLGAAIYARQSRVRGIAYSSCQSQIDELDPIATQVEEHKNPSVSHVEMKV